MSVTLENAYSWKKYCSSKQGKVETYNHLHLTRQNNKSNETNTKHNTQFCETRKEARKPKKILSVEMFKNCDPIFSGSLTDICGQWQSERTATFSRGGKQGGMFLCLFLCNVKCQQ